MAAADTLSPQDYAVLSALYDELSELDAPRQLRRLQQLQGESHPLAARLARMLAALDGPRTDALLPPLPEAPAASDRAAGQRIGPWRLLAPLGRGGMAEVWLACRDDGGLKREVALKLPFLPPGSTGALRAQRFERERDILAALRHPHIAALLDAGVELDGQAWLALERVDGERITDWCDKRRATLAQRVALFLQVLLAVQHAHAQLVIHRDLKPANVLVNAQGEVRLLDFGIAKLLGQGQPVAEDTALTQQAGHPLTPRYASPEQLRGEPLSTASDVYALGVLLHELLLGRLPYVLAHGGAAELERAIVEADVPLPSKTAPTSEAAAARGTTPRGLQRALAPELDAVLLRALAKQPAERYRSVDALLDDIERWRAGVPVRARTPSTWFRLRRFVARHPLGVGTGVVAVAGLAGLALAATLFGMKAREESARATVSRDFLMGVFSKADSDQSRGAEISAREMLDWGRRRAAALDAEPLLRAGLLMDIGQAQRDATDYVGAALSFDDAAGLLRELGHREGLMLAECFRAELALRRGDLAAAQAFLGAAHAALPAAAGPALRARLAQIEGWLATRQGRSAEAVGHDERAAAAAARAWLVTDDRRVQIVLQLASSSEAVGQGSRAVALLARLGKDLQAAGFDDPSQFMNIEYMRGSVELRMGQYGDVAARLESSLPRCAASIGAQRQICARLRQQRALALMRTGRQAQAETLVDGIRTEVQGNAPSVQRSESLLLWARIVAGGGRVDGAAQPWRELQAMAKDGEAATQPLHIRVLVPLVLAEGEVRAGRPEGAQPWITIARQRLAESRAKPPLLASRVDALEGAALWMGGRAEYALLAWRRARAEAARGLGAAHPLTWMYALNSVPALLATGRTQEAEGILAQGLSALRLALGPDAPHLESVAGWQHQPLPAGPAAALGFLL